jgi:hypothetical protein
MGVSSGRRVTQFSHIVFSDCVFAFDCRKLIIPPAPKPPPRAKPPPTAEPPVPSNDDAPPQPSAAAGKSAAAAGGGGAGSAAGNLPNGTRVRVVRSYAGQVLPREEVRTGETTSLAHGWYYCLMDDSGQVGAPEFGVGRRDIG